MTKSKKYFAYAFGTNPDIYDFIGKYKTLDSALKAAQRGDTDMRINVMQVQYKIIKSGKPTKVVKGLKNV